MSDDNDLILGAIADGATDRKALVDATGLEPKNVSNRLFYLQSKGLIAKNASGWEVTGAPPPKARTVPLMSRGDDEIPQFVPPRVPAEGDEPEPRKPPAKANGKHRPASVVDEPTPAPALTAPAWLLPDAALAPVERELEFAISESGAILFKTLTGDRAGQLGEINCSDALALYRLMSSVQFVVENA